MSTLEVQARELAEDLRAVLSAFSGAPVDLETTASGDKAIVRLGRSLPLAVGDRPLLSLTTEYRCVFDSAESYLAVDESRVKVFAGGRAKGDPLFRYEYLRSGDGQVPSSHLHVHAHRDAFAHVMALAGEQGAARRQPDVDGGVRAAAMSRVHFPLGGHRFRPTLEDVLQMLQCEFGVTAAPGWEAVLHEQRAAFRRRQTAAAVRDCPSEAVRVLESMGSRVMLLASGLPADRADRLEAF